MHRALPNHLPGLDGLRGVAVLLVVVHNLRRIVEPLGDPWSLVWVQALDRGWIGVQLFFVLSGFLITRILLRSRDAENYYSGFYARRLLRIAPLYYAALLVCVVILPHVLGYSRNPSTDIFLWLFLSNWMQPFHHMGGLVHFWSLAVEEQFYLVWPFAIRRVNVLRFCLGVAAVALGARIALLAAGFSFEVLYDWTICRMDALALGGAAAALQETGVPRWLTARALPWIVLAAGAAVSRGYRQTGALAQTAGYSLLAVGFALWILAIAADGQWSGRRWLRWAWLRRLGKYSYGMYVIHMPFRAVGEWALEKLGWAHSHPLLVDLIYVPAMLAIVFGLAFVSYHGFEKRFLLLKRRFEPSYATA